MIVVSCFLIDNGVHPIRVQSYLSDKSKFSLFFSQKHYLEALQRGATLPAQASFRYQPCNSMPTETNRFLANEWQGSWSFSDL